MEYQIVIRRAAIILGATVLALSIISLAEQGLAGDSTLHRSSQVGAAEKERLLAIRGSAKAQTNLGFLYATGRGVHNIIWGR